MKIVPIDIAHKTFAKKMMGFDPAEVSDFLNSVASEMEDLIRERNDLREQVRERDLRILEYKERDKVLNNTIETAQKMSEKIREESEREGKLILNDANQKADLITRDARDSLKKVYQEITDLKKARVQIEANLRALLQAHMQLLNEQLNAMPEIGLPQTIQEGPSQSTHSRSTSVSPLSTK